LPGKALLGILLKRGEKLITYSSFGNDFPNVTLFCVQIFFVGVLFPGDSFCGLDSAHFAGGNGRKT
jgi:hypothetical protein